MTLQPPEGAPGRLPGGLKGKSRMLGGCGSSSVPYDDSNTKKPCVPSEAILLTLLWTLGDGFCLDFTTFGFVMMAKGHSSAQAANGTPELPKRPCSPEQGPRTPGLPGGPGAHWTFQGRERGPLTSSSVSLWGPTTCSRDT